METPTVSASERMRSRWRLDERRGDRTLVPTTSKRDVYATHTKQEAVNEIAAAAGIAAPTLGQGCTVPKALFVGVVEALGLPVDTNQAIVGIATDIAYLADIGWDVLSDSTAVASRNTSAITVRGLIKLRDAIVAMHGKLGVDKAATVA